MNSCLRYSSPRGSPAHSVTSTTTTTTTTTTSSAATTPAGYTSRFVAHVDHGQNHHQANSDSNNPHDRNRFRTFSDEHDEPSTVDRVEVDGLAATNADYDIDGSMVVVKPQSNNERTHVPDDSTDTDETITSSSSSSAARSKSLEGSGNDRDSRIENRSVVNDDALVEGRSGNDVSSSLSARIERLASLARPFSAARDSGYQPDEIASFDESLGTSRTETAINGGEYANGSNGDRDFEENVQSNSESESESTADSGSETDEEEESRDENSNIKNKKTESPERGGTPSPERCVPAREDDSDSEEESISSETDDRIAVSNVPFNSHSEDSHTLLERYDDRSAKRRSSSILEEKSIEELFDDNGWVITDQDLQAENPRRISKSFESIDPDDSLGLNENNTDESSSDKLRGDETTDKVDDHGTTENGKVESSTSESSGSLSRSRVYRQSSIGKNGWLVSDESETESDRAVSPVMGNPSATESWRNPVRIENERTSRDGGSTPVSATNEKESGKDSMVPDNLEENGWVILNKVNDPSSGKDVEGESTDETSTIRSQTTDLVLRANVENGALVANAAQSKESESRNENEDAPGVDIAIPMQMVTTVFCVSVLCYSVLINLFL